MVTEAGEMNDTPNQRIEDQIMEAKAVDDNTIPR